MLRLCYDGHVILCYAVYITYHYIIAVSNMHRYNGLRDTLRAFFPMDRPYTVVCTYCRIVQTMGKSQLRSGVQPGVGARGLAGV